MKFFNKKMTAMALAAVMSLSMATGVFAAEATTLPAPIAPISKVVSFTDVKPMIKDNKTFVPFASAMQSLGATDIAYDGATKTVTAKLDGKTINIVVDQMGGKINGKMFTSFSPAFISSGRTYVTVDAIEKITGLMAKTDVEKQQITFTAPTFEIMNKYLEYNKQFMEKNYTMDGTFDFKINVADGTTTTPVSAKGTIKGITSSEAVNMNMAMNIDFSKVLATLEDPTEATTAKEELKKFENITFDFIMDITTGKMYMNCPLISNMMNIEENAWILVDMQEMFGAAGVNMNFTELLKMSTETDFNKYLETFKTMDMGTISSEEMLYTINKMYADQAFVKNPDNYTSTMTINEMGINSATSFIFYTKDDKVTGYGMSMATSMNGVEIMKIAAEQKSMDKATATMTMNIPGMMTMDGKLTLNTKETTSKPSKAPASSAKVVNLMDTLSSMMTVTPEAPATSATPDVAAPAK